MRLQKLIFLASFAIAATANAQVRLGIDVLQEHGFSVLAGKRVGLITNQTGVNSAGERTRVILRRAPNVKLVALFTHEHGLDGTELAGRYVPNRMDRVTGLIAHSLYGPTRKPTPEMLRGIDVLVFDMQDIGCRSYTYISTMGRCMEAAGENGIEFVVLDRPNPLGGERVEGPGIESQWISFVGQIPVPYVHGMTVGELARMANARGWAGARCKLSVVNMQGWTRPMVWQDTGLRWVPTSPNIPRASSPMYYVATGILGELSPFEIGIGTSEPFEVISSRCLNARSFTAKMRSLNMPGTSFSEYQKDRYAGSRIRISPRTEANLTALGIYMLRAANDGCSVFAPSSRGKLEMFYKVYGSSSIRSQIERRQSVASIVAGWSPGVQRFRAERMPYLLY